MNVKLRSISSPLPLRSSRLSSFSSSATPRPRLLLTSDSILFSLWFSSKRVFFALKFSWNDGFQRDSRATPCSLHLKRFPMCNLFPHLKSTATRLPKYNHLKTMVQQNASAWWEAVNQQLTTTLLDCWSTLTLSAGHARVLKPSAGAGSKCQSRHKTLTLTFWMSLWDPMSNYIGLCQGVQNVHSDWKSVHRRRTLYYRSRVGPFQILHKASWWWSSQLEGKQGWLKVHYNVWNHTFKYEKTELLVYVYEIPRELVFI